MLYALSRADGSIALTTVLPNTITADGKTMPVVGVDLSEPKLFAKTDGEQLITFPLLTNDARRIEADSVSGATMTFYDIEEIIAKSPDDYVSYATVSADSIPPHRDYRNGWTYTGTTIAHSMPLCRELHRTKLRETRKPMLETLDIAYQRADEQDDGPLKRNIAQQKQALRDITANPLIDSAADIDALKLLTVEYLLAHP